MKAEHELPLVPLLFAVLGPHVLEAVVVEVVVVVVEAEHDLPLVRLPLAVHGPQVLEEAEIVEVVAVVPEVVVGEVDVADEAVVEVVDEAEHDLLLLLAVLGQQVLEEAEVVEGVAVVLDVVVGKIDVAGEAVVGVVVADGAVVERVVGGAPPATSEHRRMAEPQPATTGGGVLPYARAAAQLARPAPQGRRSQGTSIAGIARAPGIRYRRRSFGLLRAARLNS